MNKPKLLSEHAWIIEKMNLVPIALTRNELPNSQQFVLARRCLILMEILTSRINAISLFESYTLCDEMHTMKCSSFQPDMGEIKWNSYYQEKWLPCYCMYPIEKRHPTISNNCPGWWIAPKKYCSRSQLLLGFTFFVGLDESREMMDSCSMDHHERTTVRSLQKDGVVWEGSSPSDRLRDGRKEKGPITISDWILAKKSGAYILMPTRWKGRGCKLFWTV